MHGLRRPFCVEQGSTTQCTPDSTNCEGVIIPRGRLRCHGCYEEEPSFTKDQFCRIRRIRCVEDLEDEKPTWYVPERECTFDGFKDVDFSKGCSEPVEWPVSPGSVGPGVFNSSPCQLTSRYDA